MRLDEIDPSLAKTLHGAKSRTATQPALVKQPFHAKTTGNGTIAHFGPRCRDWEQKTRNAHEKARRLAASTHRIRWLPCSRPQYARRTLEGLLGKPPRVVSGAGRVLANRLGRRSSVLLARWACG